MTGSAPAQKRATARSAARLAAVQALYQMDLTGIDLTAVAAEFQDHRLGEAIEGEEIYAAETAFFLDLIQGVVAEQRRIDPLINERLATGWHLSRIDSILRAILRAGTFEILRRSDVPARVSLNEYVDLAHAFFQGEEPKVVNGLLDRIAKEVRSDELAPAGSRSPDTASERDGS